MSKISEKIEEFLTPIVEELGYEIVEVEFAKKYNGYNLTVFIDKPGGGININDCEAFHRAIDPILDDADPISESYILEVSSPGIERELKYPEHIDACEGWDVEVKLYAPRNGSKLFRGVLCGYDDDGNIVVAQGEERIAFKPEEIGKISTYFDFSNS